MTVLIRQECPADHGAIRSLTARAFARLSFSDGSESHIIDVLRAANALALSLVAVARDQLVGHVAFSAVGPDALKDWFALGPVSVEPRFQRRGIGKQLIEAGLQDLRARCAKGCVLVGDHRYYHRFGFILAPALAPSTVQAEHFQVHSFGPSVPGVPVAFHPAFWATT